MAKSAGKKKTRQSYTETKGFRQGKVFFVLLFLLSNIFMNKITKEVKEKTKRNQIEHRKFSTEYTSLAM